MALSIGFGNSISLLPAIQATRLLTFASVGLPPTEHTCFFLVALPYGGFSPVRLEGWHFRRCLPNASLNLSLLPAYTGHGLVCCRRSCISPYSRMSRTASGRLGVDAPPWRLGSPPPQGPSLGPELFCLGSSSLNRPHPPRSRAHRDFAAWRLIRGAFAVRERLSDPRVVPGFRWLFRLDMPSSMTPGSSIIVVVQFSDVDIGLRRDLSGSTLPKFPQSASRGARISGAARQSR